MSKEYKIRNKITGEFWDGYSGFSKSGRIFKNINSPSHWLIARNRYSGSTSLMTQADNLELVEYEISKVERSTSSFILQVARQQYNEYMESTFGVSFSVGHKKFSDEESGHRFKFAVSVPYEVANIKSLLTSMGHSSKQYRKKGRWVWVENDDIVINIKLLTTVDTVINLEDYERVFDDYVAYLSKTTRVPIDYLSNQLKKLKK